MRVSLFRESIRVAVYLVSGVTVDNLLARQQIYDTLCRYCRGLDRMDKAMALSVWQEKATALYHGMYEGTGHGFVDWVWGAHAVMERHSHQIANSLIEVDGDSAKSETYVTIALWTLPDEKGDQTEIIAKGRYLDQWARHKECWLITHREYVHDMESLQPLSRGEVSEASRRDSADPSFKFITKYQD